MEKDRLYDALRNAHAAGDTAAAQRLADYIRTMPSEQSAAEKPAVVRAGTLINDIPRQVGLTARYGLEGLANTTQIFTEPIRYLQDKVTGQPSKPLGMVATEFADRIGLPAPQNATERVVGDATRLMAGSGGVIKASQAAGNALSGGAQKVFTAMASNPTAQLTAAAGGGLAGGSSREAGGSSGQQVASALLGTVVGGMTPIGINKIVSQFNAMRTSPMQLEGKIALALKEGGVDYASLPVAVRQSLLSDVRRAMFKDGELNPDALRRLADFKATGLTPTRGTVTLDPVQLTREKNLAKIGANTADEGLSGLAQTQNQNNAKLIENLNALGAASGNVDDAGNAVVSTITGRQSALRNVEQSAWDAAKSSPGYRQPISAKVISDVNQALGDEGLMPFMNPTISKYMEAFQRGQPFTPQDYRNLQSMLAREVAKGGNEGAAANVARRVLERADIMPISNPNGINFGNLPSTPQMAAAMRQVDAAPASSIDAVNRARAATRAAYSYEDSSPLVRSVLSDGASADPQRIAQRFVIGGTPTEAATLVREVGPQGVPVIKNAILAHLKSKAVNGAADEVANFSQSAFNKALRDIGNEKLRMFFSPEEIAALQANGRVASYLQVQPAGSAVNNSNSGALMMGGAYDWINAIASKVPAGKQLIVDPLRSIDISLSQRQAQNLGPALLKTQPNQPPPLLGPAAAMGGLLAAPAPNRP